MAREPLFVLLVRIQIIEDDLEPGLGIGRNNLVHEGQELLAAPALLVRARDLARRHLERGESWCRAAYSRGCVPSACVRSAASDSPARAPAPGSMVSRRHI